MKQTRLLIDNIPALLCGEKSERVFLCVHGQGGSKECAADFECIAEPLGMQALGIDLPAHGERAGEGDAFYPWNAVPEIKKAYDYLKGEYKSISLRADSIGAWFALTALKEERCEQCLLVSPLLSMNALIEYMMKRAGVTEEELLKKESITLSDGTLLSYRYLLYAREHRITSLPGKTDMLFGDGENITPPDTATEFANTFGASLTVAPGCGHWFHTPHELEALREWTIKNLRRM